MVEYEILKQFVTFYRTGTLSGTSEKLLISQSTLTRSMQKLESIFEVPLFTRTKNSIALNETGLLAAQDAEILLYQTEQMLRRARDYDRANKTILIGACTPVPVPELIRRISQHRPEATISSETKNIPQLLEGLKTGTYQLILLPFCPEDTELACSKFGEEHLSFLLPKRHRFAKRKYLSVSEMNGENMLLFQEIGFWHDLVSKKMPDSRFLMQTERYTFLELIENSSMPVFTTDAYQGPVSHDRVSVPITDPEFNVTYFLVYKRENKKEYGLLAE